MAGDDLSDEQLDVIGNLAESGALGATAYSTRQLVREVRRHRSAVAASKERVRRTVMRAYDDEMVARNQGATGSQARHINDFIDAIATRAAEQLATTDRDHAISVIDYVLGESGLGPISRASVRAYALKLLAGEIR